MLSAKRRNGDNRARAPENEPIGAGERERASACGSVGAEPNTAALALAHLAAHLDAHRRNTLE